MKLTKKGFTLVELMVVIVIVGILAAVAIPKFTMASHKAKASEFPTVLMQYYTAEIAYEAETGNYSDEGAIGISTTHSRWFSYFCTYDNTTDPKEFLATADVLGTGFGSLTGDETGTINHLGDKQVTGTFDLKEYASSWQPNP